MPENAPFPTLETTFKKPPPSREPLKRAFNIFRPWAVWLIAATALFVSNWFALALTDFRDENGLASLRTGGWFWLGLPGAIGLSCSFGLLFAFLARKLGALAGLFCVLLACAPLLYFSIKGAMPEATLALAIGDKAAADATMLELREYDSFNDGTTIVGVIDGPDTLLPIMAEENQLIQEERTGLVDFHRYFDDREFPLIGTAWRGDRLHCYQDAEGRIYFIGYQP